MEGGGGNRGEAERWLYTANKVLRARDLHGARSFAIRARESDPRYEPTELLLTVIDTLMAGEARINDHLDWYSILQVLPYTQNIEYIASQYHRLASQLDPHHNPFAFAAHASSLVHDAWSVLSNPTKKTFYDNQLRLLTQPPPPPPPPPVSFFPIQPPPPNLNPPPTLRMDLPSQHDNATELTRPSDPLPLSDTFWTACPYCYVMYEYPKVYEDCTLRCQSCRRGFHAVVVRSPPKDDFGSFSSWGFFPVGFSGHFKDINGSSSNWNPFSPLFPCSFKGADQTGRHTKGSWVFYDDEASAEFVEAGSDTTQDDSDDGDWRAPGVTTTATRRKKRRRKAAARPDVRIRREPVERPATRGLQNGADNDNVDNVDAAVAALPESSKKSAAFDASRRRSERNLGKLDLNVEFSIEVEEPVHGVAEGNAEDNIEGIGFFEGLDEFLSSLPILNVVADDKVKGH